jgi:hypothetical protein
MSIMERGHQLMPRGKVGWALIAVGALIFIGELVVTIIESVV